MTEQEQEEEQLPTAAYLLKHQYIVNEARSDRKIATSKPINYFNTEEIDEVDELVRRQDVEQLIITVQNQYSKHQNWEDNSEQQAIVDSLIKELLEEVQNQ